MIMQSVLSPMRKQYIYQWSRTSFDGERTGVIPFAAEICCVVKLSGACENATSATKYTRLEGTPSDVLNRASSEPSDTLISTLGGRSAPYAAHLPHAECAPVGVCDCWGSCTGLGATALFSWSPAVKAWPWGAGAYAGADAAADVAVA